MRDHEYVDDMQIRLNDLFTKNIHWNRQLIVIQSSEACDAVTFFFKYSVGGN